MANLMANRWYVWYGHPRLDEPGYVWQRYKVVCESAAYAESLATKPAWVEKFLQRGGLVHILQEGLHPEPTNAS